MIMDGTIFKLGDDHCFSITSYDSDLDWFRQVASDRGMNVEVPGRDRENDAPPPGAGAEGPAKSSLRSLEGMDLHGLRYFRFEPGRQVKVAGIPCLVSRTGYSGELGYELYCEPERAVDLWNAVLDAGEPQGMLPIGLSAIETLRIESGLLFPDIDYFPHGTDPL